MQKRSTLYQLLSLLFLIIFITSGTARDLHAFYTHHHEHECDIKDIEHFHGYDVDQQCLICYLKSSSKSEINSISDNAIILPVIVLNERQYYSESGTDANIYFSLRAPPLGYSVV